MINLPSPAQVITATALVSTLLPSASANTPEELNSKAYTMLVHLLEQEIACLKGMIDTSSAAAAQAELSRIREEESQLGEHIPDAQSFSLFVIRSDEHKTQMNHLLLELTVERQRVSKANYFDVAELRALLVD